MADVKFIDFIGDIVDSIRQGASIISITNTPSTNNYVVVVTDLLDLAVGKMVSIGGVEYQITEINTLTPSFTVSALVAPVGTQLNTSYPFYIHGRFIAANNELNQISNSLRKYPLIYLAENYSTRENLDPNLQIGDNVSCSIFIMNSSNYEDFTTEEHYTYTIDAMDSIANSFIDKLKTNQFVQYREFSELERIRHTKWGLEVTNKGTTTNLFDDNLSGVELRLQIPIRKSINHCGRYNNIDFKNCADVTIFEDGVFLESIPSGGSFSYSTSSGGDVVIDINTKLYSTENAPSTINIPVLNSDANEVGTVTSGVNVVILDSAAQINGVTFEMIPAETTIDIPVLNSDGNPIGIVDPGIQVNIEDSFVENSSLSYSNQFASGTTFVLPDINLTQPNGDIDVNPSMTDLSCTLIEDLTTQDLNDDLTPTQINRIQRRQPTRSGQITQYRSGDDGNLQMGIGASFSTLSDLNIFGTNQRFTDELGGQTYTNKFVLDHSTGLMWYIALTTATQWNGAIDGALASTQGGFTDWALPNINQLISICNFSIATNSLLNYSPFNIAITTTTDRIWTSTTVPSTPSVNAYCLYNLGQITGTGKSTTQSYIICRKWIPSDFGL
jgi:hypothetical protein